MLTHHLNQLDSLDLEQVEFQLDQHTRSRKKGNQLSWSYSRHRLFNRCKRQYYLHYYGSRRVRSANDIVISTVWWLKQLTSMRAWIGTIVHRAARRLVNGLTDLEKSLTPDELVQYAQALFDDGIQASQRGRKSDYSRWVLLSEDAYQQPYDLTHAREKLATLTTNLFDHPAYDLIAKSQSIIENDSAFQSFKVDIAEVGEIAVYAVPDVLIVEGGEAIIIDWKSSTPKHEDMQSQGSIYSFYTYHMHQFSDENIRAIFAILDEPAMLQAKIDSHSVTRAMIADSVQQMSALFEDPHFQTVSIKDFPMTDELTRCETCSFRRICWRQGL